jgi:hypothetical protein
MRYTRDRFAVKARKILAQRGVLRTSRTREGVIVGHTRDRTPIFANHHGAAVVGETPERHEHLHRMAAETAAHAHPATAAFLPHPAPEREEA